MEYEHFETKAIRTQLDRTSHQEHSNPLFLTSSFTFDSAEQGAAIFQGEIDANLYSRFSNPNTNELVDKLCALEGTQSGVVTASGMAAIFVSFAALLQAGDHVVACKSIFGNSKYILSHILSKWGIDVTYVAIDDHDGWTEAIQENTKLLFLESPSNPTLLVADFAFLKQLCIQHDIIFAVDNCFATPYLQKPAKFGADLVIHSATKYIDGQGRVLGGAILGPLNLINPCYDFIRRTGPSLSPFNAWILSKSLETLSIRMERHSENALAIAHFLESENEVDYVIYPHLKSHPQYDLAKFQMKLGGGLVGCQIRGGQKRGAKFLNKLKLHSLTANLGDTRSIATHPASTTHSKLTPAEQLEADITPGFIRFSVGLEHKNDIIQDIKQALEKSK